MDRIVLTVDGTSIKNVEQFDVRISRTYTDEIKRTMKGVVKTFPQSYVTIGVSISCLMEVREATDLVYRLTTKDTVIMSGVNSKYDVGGTVSATEEPRMERVHDKGDDIVRLTFSLVSVGIPVVAVSTAVGGKIAITLPAMT